MNIRDYGYQIGSGKTGPHNKITDVPGVRVGHCTVDQDDVHTGVTVIFPCAGNAYEEKPVAAASVLSAVSAAVLSAPVESAAVSAVPDAPQPASMAAARAKLIAALQCFLIMFAPPL